MKFDAHPCTKSLKVLEHHIHKVPVVASFSVTKKLSNTATYERQAPISATIIQAVKVWSCITLRIWVQQNTCFTFFHPDHRKGFRDIIKTINIFINSLHKLFHQFQFYVKWRQDNAIPINQWRIYDIFIAYCKIFSCRPILLYQVLISSATVLVTKKTRMFGVPPFCPNKNWPF